ncbi:unnamed protein product [Acanthoscelides obtectus]|uniref:Uncharacterized protein n=1 Tax=Acanthoscelides obtectus TaxID=200917 RepID=A0A9P0LDD4_ACAOB|nr:unnamed protein product [Acanthoscelides obtectus]CAK1645978.1 hypothetical protein AOBTE_LOCUS14371 [Acanthoscelides obtectus]
MQLVPHYCCTCAQQRSHISLVPHRIQGWRKVQDTSLCFRYSQYACSSLGSCSSLYIPSYSLRIMSVYCSKYL